MRPLSLFALLALAVHAPAQVLTASKILSGSGTDAASAIAVDSQGNVFVAGTTTSNDFPIVNGLFTRIRDASLRSSTDGKTFTPSTLAPSSVTAIASSLDGHTLLAATFGLIYLSVDGGSTWTASQTAISGLPVALGIDPVNPSNAYAVVNFNSNTVFYRSADGGVTWQSNGAVGPQQTTVVSRIIIDPRNPASIYAFFSNGLYHSLDSGTTWQQTFLPGSSVPNDPAKPVAFAIAPSLPQTIYAITNLGPPQKSTDGGATWQSIAYMSTTSVNTFAVDPQNPNVLWFTDSTGIERSVDGGASVQTVAKMGGGAWQAIAIDPGNSSHIFAADPSNLYASLDDGATWNVAATGQFSGLLATPLAIYATGAVPPTLFLAKLDPTLTRILFSTFIGPVEQYGIAVALDAAGNPLVTGITQWADFPTTANALEPTPAGNMPGFAVKVRGDGGALLYSTFLDNFTPGGAAFDSSGNAVIVGTAQTGFAPSAGAYQTAVPGPCTRQPIGVNFFPPSQSGHAFIAKVSANGSSLLYGTYLTGSCGDAAGAVQLDSAGNIYVTGFTYSLDFPITSNAMTGAFPKGASTSGFVSELSGDGSRLLYSSFFGGGENNRGNALALDVRGNVYVAGYTQTPASKGALAVANSGGCEYIINIGPSVDESYEYEDGFVMKMALSAAPPAFFATIGGSCTDSVQSLSLDGGGNIWVAGTTASGDFPTVAPIGALGVGSDGNGGFVAEVDPTGSSLLFSTFTGGYNNISAAVAATRSGAFVASSIAGTSKAGAASAIAGFIDDSQSPPIAIDAIQSVSSPVVNPPQAIPVFLPPAVAPGELVELKGRGIGPADEVDAKLTAAGFFPVMLGGVQVSFNGTPAPLISVQANQIECQAPFELDGAASVNIEVQYNGQASNAFPAAVVAQQVSALAVSNADGTPNSAANPAKIGSVVAIYLTGLGQTIPAGVDGAINGGAIAARTPPAIYVNGNNAQPAFLGAAPGESSGVFQLNLVAPATQNGAASDSVAIIGPNLNLVSLQLYVK